MASYNPATVRAAIKAIITAINSVQSVYDFPNPTIDGYPAVIFELSNEDGAMLDDITNMRTLTFEVWIACEVAVEGLAAGVALLDATTKDVINALESRTNQTLGGACDWMMPVVGKREQIGSPEGNYLYQQLLLKVNIASSI